MTRITRHIRGPRASVYDALLDKDLIAQWKVPDAMTCQVHEFEAREGGTDLHATHEGLPPGVSPADNELGWTMALAKLAAIVESP